MNINPSHLNMLSHDFGLGKMLSVGRISSGVSNRCFLLNSERGQFVIKALCHSNKSNVTYVHEVEKFIYSNGIPSICMMLTKCGDVCAEYETQLYTVYKYTDQSLSQGEPYRFVRESGRLLGLIHKISQGHIPRTLKLRQFILPDPHISKTKLRAIRARILRNAQSKADDAFITFIGKKLHYLKCQRDYIGFNNDTLIHGDFHKDNLIFSCGSNSVVGICDWDDAKMAPRSYEVARSIIYLCFAGHGSIRKGIKYARAFVEAYRSACPISANELSDGMHLHFKQLLTSTWLEERHYLQNDTRASKFIYEETRFVSHEFMQILANALDLPNVCDA